MRLAETRDAEAITALVNSAFRKAESFFIDPDRIDAESDRAFMEKGQFLIAEKIGALAGCVYVEERGERGYLGLFRLTQLSRTVLGPHCECAENYGSKLGCRFMDLRIVNLRKKSGALQPPRICGDRY